MKCTGKIAAARAIAGITIGIMLRWVTIAETPALEIWFFDVGQGDSALVRFADGTRWLLDAGGKVGRHDRGRLDLVPELTRLGALSIEAAILSHPDQDHGYGFRGVLGAIAVRELWVSATSPQQKPLMRELKTLAAQRATAVRLWERGERWQQGGAAIEVMPVGEGEATNDRALLLAIEWAGCRLFFAADAEAGVERVLLRDRRTVDLLKVPHHGSRTSSTEAWLAAIAPRWAVVSVGAENRYGHPNREVLRRYARRHAVVLRTDLHGFVHFRIEADGKVRCTSASGECGESRCGRGRP